MILEEFINSTGMKGFVTEKGFIRIGDSMNLGMYLQNGVFTFFDNQKRYYYDKYFLELKMFRMYFEDKNESSCYFLYKYLI